MINFLIRYLTNYKTYNNYKGCKVYSFPQLGCKCEYLLSVGGLHTGLSFCIVVGTGVKVDSFLSARLTGVEGSLGFLLTNKLLEYREVSDETRFYLVERLKELSLATEVIVATLLTNTKEVSEWNPRINY